MSARIGLVLLDYDQASTTLRCLRSVAAGRQLPDEIVLVENGRRPVEFSSDPELAALGISRLRPGRNVGAAAGRNLGVDHLLRDSEVDRIVLLDNDTVVPAEFFELAADHPLDTLEIVAPLLIDARSGEVFAAGGTFDGRRRPRVVTEWPADRTEAREVDWAPTAALMFGRQTWFRVGPFDPWYRFLWEDTEWCHRAVRAGASIRVVPGLRVVHEPHQSTGGAFNPERVRQWTRNGTVFMFETTGWRSRFEWLGSELARIVRELRAGARWRSVVRARLRGLAQGLVGLAHRWRRRRLG